jgi:hypothetical protein
VTVSPLTISTYYLESPYKELLFKYRHSSRLFESHTTRAVCVRVSPPPPRNGVTLVKAEEGDHFEEGLRWIRRNLLDDLHDEYLARIRTIPEKERLRLQRSSLRRFLAAERAVVAAEEARTKAVQDRYQAALDCLRAHGRSSIQVGIDMYDFNFDVLGRIYLIRRSNKT